MKPSKVEAAAFACVICCAMPVLSFGFDGTFRIGAGGEYSILERDNSNTQSHIRGGGGIINAMYGFTDSLGVSIEAGNSWYDSYHVESQQAGDQTDTDGGDGQENAVEDNEESEEEKTEVVSKQRPEMRSLGLAVIYALDVMRAMPFLSIGVAYVRIEEVMSEGRRVDHELGLRFCIGVEYMLSDRLALGVLGGYERYITDTYEYRGRMSLVARISFVLGAGRFKMMGL